MDPMNFLGMDSQRLVNCSVGLLESIEFELNVLLDIADVAIFNFHQNSFNKK